MCCFSQGRAGTVLKHVSGTRIFARATEGTKQILVYSMNLEASGELAMILPLPIRPGSELRFINLEGYADLFSDLDRAFPAILAPAPLSRGPGGGGGAIVNTLPVHAVGGFEASFVPSLAEFARLDERFVLPTEVWAQLPDYAEHGFAVFKLKDLKKRFWQWSRKRTIHPMAFELERRHDSGLFYPTLHIHDGKVQKYADFDHQLYHQQPGAKLDQTPTFFPNGETSTRPIGESVDVTRAQGILDGSAHLYRVTLRGRLENRDTWLFNA